MFLTEASPLKIIWNQYLFKMKAYASVFSSLVIIQLLGILLSLAGTSSRGSSTGGLSINITYYSADMVIAFTALWGFICALLLTTKAYREDDFTFVTNRMTSNLSSMVFVLTASVLGGITALLSGFLLKFIVYFFFNDEVISAGLVSDPFLFAQGTLNAVLLILFVSSLGYLVGVLSQWHSSFTIVCPAVFLGLILIQGAGKGTILQSAYGFFFEEPLYLLFFIKMTGSILLFFGGAILLSNQLEVKK